MIGASQEGYFQSREASRSQTPLLRSLQVSRISRDLHRSLWPPSDAIMYSPPIRLSTTRRPYLFHRYGFRRHHQAHLMNLLAVVWATITLLRSGSAICIMMPACALCIALTWFAGAKLIRFHSLSAAVFFHSGWVNASCPKPNALKQIVWAVAGFKWKGEEQWKKKLKTAHSVLLSTSK
jgi:hypothetical protein